MEGVCMICTNCGKQLPTGSKGCQYCGAALGSGKKVLGLILILAILGGLAVLAWMLLGRDAFSKQFDQALQRKEIFAPPGQCAADLYSAQKAKNPNSASLAEASKKLAAAVQPSVDDAFARWTKDSDQKVDWAETQRSCALLASLHPEDKKAGARQAYAKAQQCMVAKQYDQAKNYYSEALALQPQWGVAMNGLGKIYMRTDSPFHDEAAALKLYYRAVKEDPQFTWAYFNIGLYYLKNRDSAQAKEWFIRALNTNANQPSVLRTLGDVSSSLGDYQGALGYYQNALQNEKDIADQEKLRATIQKLQDTTATQ
jgi:tetratricopeptide (TPR) repeat protein